ncbi:hypothetical protein BGW38_004410 [Lunasporangiospora selenospora]|uniref:Uncharacterized protein n=1 Tax=Lunasporangiospora selenospora TaxID=979761 RepID=A0A9P6G007_9FUNG|nr:hypothetical protein BGW38_004410 [Lunasporangiospora selenospora]
MKNLSLVLAATTLAAFAQADMIQINNPTAGTSWTAGVANFVGWTDLTVPLTVAPGTYSIVVRTAPQMSYTNMFTITNPTVGPPETNNPPTSPGTNGTNSGSNTPSTGSSGGKSSDAVKTSSLCQVLASVGLAAFTAAQFLL